MATAARARFWRILDRTLLVLALAPVLIWILSIIITMGLSYAGCQIDEGSAHSCVIAGQELAEFAYTSGVFAAWGGLLMLPTSFSIFMLWGVLRLIRLLFRARRSGSQTKG